MAKNAAALVAEAKAKVENLDVEQAAKEISNGDALVVDVREPGELAEHGVIPGSVHAPRGMLEFHADPETPYHLDALDPDRRIIVHCAKGSRSALACTTLEELGYSNVANLDGGFEAWVAAGQPVEQI